MFRVDHWSRSYGCQVLVPTPRALHLRWVLLRRRRLVTAFGAFDLVRRCVNNRGTTQRACKAALFGRWCKRQSMGAVLLHRVTPS